MSALAGTCRLGKGYRFVDTVSPQLDLRAADLASRLLPGADVTRWPNRGTAGAPQDAVPAVPTSPTFVSNAAGGAVRFVGDDYLRLATLFADQAEQTYYGLTPKLVSVVFASPTYRTVAGYGAQRFLDFATGFVYVPGQVIQTPAPASSTHTVLTAWVYPSPAFASGLAIQVLLNEQASPVYEFAHGQLQADFFIGHGNSGQIPETGQLDVLAVRGHFRLVAAAEAQALHKALMQTYL